MGHRLEIGILGPLEIRVDGEIVRAGGPRQRALLVLLLLEAGRAVRAEELADQLWNGTPPHSSMGTLHAYVSRLRRVLGDQGAENATALRSSSSGYLLDVADSDVDARRFEHEVERGRRLHEQGDHATAAAVLRDALELWRGRALADFSTEQWAQLDIVRLDEIKRAAEETWADAELALGHHHTLIPWLENHVARNPMRERSVSQLMLALYRSGRQTEALAAFLELRRVLAGELGIDPAPSSERLYQSILNHDRLEPVPAPADNLPPRNQTFAGRAAVLRAMWETLTSTAEPNLVALHGLGGVGKTELALEYAHLHAEDYDLRWHVSAADPTAMCRGFVALCEELGLPDRVDCSSIAATVAAHLKERDRWLLVLDDVEDESVVKCLPHKHNGHIVIISRSPVWSRHAHKILVEPFRRNESVEFLRHRIELPGEDVRSAELLAEELGDLPLALDQASTFVEQTGMGLDEYLELFRRHTSELLRRGTGERTVATVWQLAFDAVAQASPAARDLLYLCAALDAHSVPLRLLRGRRGVLPPALEEAATDEIGLEDAIAALLRHGLVQRDGHRLNMHRLVRTAAFLAIGTDQARFWIDSARRVVAAAMPGDPEDPSTWTAWDDVMSAVLALASRFEHWPCSRPPELSRLLCAAGSYLTTRALFGQAERLLELAVRQAEPRSVDLAKGMAALGKLRETTGDLEAAQRCLEQALTVVEQACDPGDEAEVGVLRRLASVLACQRKLPEARHTLTRALATVTDRNGPSWELADCYRQLGFVEWAAGDLRAAESTFGKALAATSQSSGTGHPDVAHVLSGLAWVYQEAGDLQRAGQLHEQSLAVLVGVYGDEHPEVAHAYDKLGYVRQLTGDLGAAVSAHERALSILESYYGPDHGELGWPLTNLGLAHVARQDLHAAADCQRRAERVFARTFGAGHANTQIAARRLGSVMLRDGDARGARILLERVLRISEKALGAEHPDVGRTWAALGDAHAVLGNEQATGECQARALSILESVYGPDHPDVLAVSAAQPECLSAFAGTNGRR